MNALFTRQITPPADERRQTSTTVYVENESTNTFGFVLKPSTRTVSPDLTTDDRRELESNKPPLRNTVVNVKAKRIYAAGGKAKDIETGCRVSPSYAEKLHAAFSRANPCNCKK